MTRSRALASGAGGARTRQRRAALWLEPAAGTAASEIPGQRLPRQGRHGHGLSCVRPGAPRDVAIKLLARSDPAAVEQFRREVRALAELSHPNLVSLYELAVHEG